jgi:hypothetical protein
MAMHRNDPGDGGLPVPVPHPHTGPVPMPQPHADVPFIDGDRRVARYQEIVGITRMSSVPRSRTDPSYSQP